MNFAKQCLFVIAVFGGFVPFAWADPNHIKTDAPLKLHGTISESKQLYAQLLASREKVFSMTAKLDANGGSAKEHADLFAESQRVKRIGGRLLIFGEAIGYEAQFPIKIPSPPETSKLAFDREAYLNSPEGQNAHDEMLKRYQSRQATEKRQKMVQAFQKMIQAKRFAEAEKELDELNDEWARDFFFLRHGEGQAFMNPFYEVSLTISNYMNAYRLQLAAQAKQKIYADWLKAKAEFQQSIQGVANQISANGTIQVGGKALTGPAAALEYSKNWGEIHAHLIRTAALDDALPTVTDMSASSEYDPDSRWNQESGELAKLYQNLVVSLIAAEAKAAPPQVAKSLYVDYLRLLSQLKNRTAHIDWEALCRPALTELAQKAGLTETINAYREATEDALIFRSRFVEQQIKQQEKEFARLYPVFQGELTSRVNFEGLFTENNMGPVYQASLSRIVPHVAQTVMAKKFTASHSTKIQGQTEMQMLRYTRGIYGRFMTGAEPLSDANGLMRSLNSDPQHPPLTFQGMHALLSIEQGAYESVGVEIQGVEVAASVNRFALLPASATNLVAYDEIIPTFRDLDRRSVAVVQLAVKPHWVSTKYYFSLVK